MKKRPDHSPPRSESPETSTRRAADEAALFLEAVSLLGVGGPTREVSKRVAVADTAQRVAAARPAEKSLIRANEEAHAFEEAMRALDVGKGSAVSGKKPTTISDPLPIHPTAHIGRALRVPNTPSVEGDADLFLKAMQPDVARTMIAPPTVSTAPDRQQIRILTDLDQESFRQAVANDETPADKAPSPVVPPPRSGMPDLPNERQFRVAIEKRRVRIDAMIDLHGMASLPAREAVIAFVNEALAQGHRVVRIVHGKGLHSQGDPVLRDMVRRLLRELEPDPVRLVTTAPPSLGGAGAVVVLLKLRDSSLTI